MRICGAICEYNPFHNGHLKHINFIKNVIKPDYIIIIMSGNFTQRGEIAVMDKFTRATHAIKAGADAVIELPSVFSTQTAEVFALGAVKLLASMPGEKQLCFGCESDNKEQFISLAKILSQESDDYKEKLKAKLKTGTSTLKARESIIQELYPDIDISLIQNPNNILGLEYTKAIIKNNYDIDIFPLKREGSKYLDTTINDEASSLAIRNAIQQNNKTQIKDVVPEYVYLDLPCEIPSFDVQMEYSLCTASKDVIKDAFDCNEGLENIIKQKSLEGKNIDTIITEVANKRYTSNRIRRIILSTALRINKELVKNALHCDLYLKPLAIRKDSDILNVLSMGKYPIITRKKDVSLLTGTALDAFNKDVEINNIYNAVCHKKIINNKIIKI